MRAHAREVKPVISASIDHIKPSVKLPCSYHLLWSDVLSRVTILLADDHPAMLDRVVELLSNEYEVVGTVRDGRALIEAAAMTNPDVIVSDISMPILSGIQAVKQLNENGSKAKVIFLSVNEDPDYITASLKAGALGYVTKPRLRSDLRLAITRAIDGKRFVSPSRRLEKPS